MKHQFLNLRRIKIFVKKIEIERIELRFLNENWKKIYTSNLEFHLLFYSNKTSLKIFSKCLILLVILVHKLHNLHTYNLNL